MHSSDSHLSKMFIILWYCQCNPNICAKDFTGLVCEIVVLLCTQFQLNPLEMIRCMFPMGISHIRHVNAYVLFKVNAYA